MSTPPGWQERRAWQWNGSWGCPPRSAHHDALLMVLLVKIPRLSQPQAPSLTSALASLQGFQGPTLGPGQMLCPSGTQGQFTFKIQNFEQLTVRQLIPAGISPSVLGPAQKQGKHTSVQLHGYIYIFLTHSSKTFYTFLGITCS